MVGVALCKVHGPAEPAAVQHILLLVVPLHLDALSEVTHRLALHHMV